MTRFARFLFASAVLVSSFSELPAFSQSAINPNQAHLGSVVVGKTMTASVAITVPAAATLGSIIVQPAGAAGTPEFTVAPAGSSTGSAAPCTVGVAYAANASCSVMISFEPIYAGMRYGSIQLLDENQNLIQLKYVRGTGTAPEVTFMPGNEIAFGYLPEVTGLAIDGNNKLYTALGAYNTPDTDMEVEGSEVAYTQNTDGSYTYSGQTGSWVDPLGVWMDAAGNSYIYDGVQGLWKNQGLQILGSLQPLSLTGDAFGNLYVIDSATNFIYEETLQPDAIFPQDSTYVQTQLNAKSSTLQTPISIWLDASGNLYLADASYLHKWTAQADGSFSETYRTNLTGKVTVDAGGNLYGFASTDQKFYRELQQADGSYVRSSLVSNIASPNRLSADTIGNLYYANAYNNPYESVFKEDFTEAPAFMFPSTAIGSSSAAQVVTISNSGTSPLKFSSIVFPADFAGSKTSGECSGATNLAVGASCKLTIVFNPSTPLPAGSTSTTLSESVTVSTNTLNAAGTVQTILVTGSELPGSAILRCMTCSTHPTHIERPNISGLLLRNENSAKSE